MNPAFCRVLAAVLLVMAACAPAEDQLQLEPLKVVVASNFAAPMADLALEFGKRESLAVQVGSNSTGMSYAQIKNGAPYDLFFAADADRPRLLEEEGIGIAGSRFTYAIGRLVLWTASADVEIGPDGSLDLGNPDGLTLWRNFQVERFAIANPKLAPYGLAAQQCLQKLGLWDELQPKLVFGQNVSQAHQFVHLGSSQIGLVAASQITDGAGTFWEVPTDLYQPIEQQAIQLTDHPSAAKFIEFVRGPVGRKIIVESGYSLPDS